MLYFHSWSGGKDSTASVILDHISGGPPSTIIFSEVMFDLNRGISGELPEHIDFVKNKAKPLFESWGYKVEIVHSDMDYMRCFYHVISRSKHKERNGKYSAWPMGGRCRINSCAKLKPIHDFYKQFAATEYTQYIGIAVNEPERLERLKGTNKISLLEKYGYTEEMAYDLCKKYDLLSPTYEIAKRGGCWFCPNQGYAVFAYVREKYPELWQELRELDKVENVVSHSFKYGKTLSEVEALIDEKIRSKGEAAKRQKPSVGTAKGEK